VEAVSQRKKSEEGNTKPEREEVAYTGETILANETKGSDRTYTGRRGRPTVLISLAIVGCWVKTFIGGGEAASR